VELTSDQRAELAALVNSAEVSASVATRARIVLWRAEGRLKVEVAALAGVSRPTVDLWLSRFAAGGVASLLDRPRGAPREQMPAAVRGRVLALTRTSPPAETGLSHWSSRELAAFITRTEGVYVSHHYVAKLWRETGLKPHRQGTFKVSKDPEFAAKVADPTATPWSKRRRSRAWARQVAVTSTDTPQVSPGSDWLPDGPWLSWSCCRGFAMDEVATVGGAPAVQWGRHAKSPRRRVR
jgi:transposase